MCTRAASAAVLAAWSTMSRPAWIPPSPESSLPTWDPAVAGRFIAGVAQKRKVKPLYTIGFSYSLFTFLVRILPSRTLNWLVGLLYAK